jgi:hypothetical protein
LTVVTGALIDILAAVFAVSFVAIWTRTAVIVSDGVETFSETIAGPRDLAFIFVLTLGLLRA